jgi:hypothetical protein
VGVERLKACGGAERDEGIARLVQVRTSHGRSWQAWLATRTPSVIHMNKGCSLLVAMSPPPWIDTLGSTPLLALCLPTLVEATPISKPAFRCTPQCVALEMALPTVLVMPTHSAPLACDGIYVSHEQVADG